MPEPTLAFRPWLPSTIFFLASVAGGLLLRAALVRWLRAWAKRSGASLEGLLIHRLLRPLPLWIMLAGLAAAGQSAPLSSQHVLVLHKAIVALFLSSLTFSVANLASFAVREYAKKLHGSVQATGVVDDMARVLVLVVGGLLVLSNLGISIAPLLGALGVGSLAVALALQDTLTNLFAGLHIVASEIVRVGDFIRLESGQEGEVTDVGWRVTRILDGNGNAVILPNSKLANEVVVNFHRPAPELSVSIPLGVAPGEDLAKVERVSIEVAREIQARVQGAARDHQPLVRFTAMEPAAVTLNVVLRSGSFSDRGLLVHEFVKAIQRRYGQEDIQLPKPAALLK